MSRHSVSVPLRGPWSLVASRRAWKGFAPAPLPGATADDRLRTVFRVEGDWTRAEALVRQDGHTAELELAGEGDLDAAAAQVARFLSLDVDARGWPAVGHRDPVIGRAQQALPGLRPCGFHSPYEAAGWAVLAQRVRIVQAAGLRRDLVARHGDDGAFPAPSVLRGLDLDLPGRKADYRRAAAQQVRDIGPFTAEVDCCAAPTSPTGCPAANAGSTPRSSSSTGRRPC